jgi:hypothetical protein
MATNKRKEQGAQRMPKTASGILVYLMEELGDARLRANQLKRYIQEAVDLVEKSSHRDHFFEVAAHLIHGVPQTAFKLEKALDAVALAASRMDYEEIKEGLKPEKVEELESVLEDVRLRYLQRRSQKESTMSRKIPASDDAWKVSRFEEGVPADPTENMSDEDAAEWEAMNDKYEDKFKKAASGLSGSISEFLTPWLENLGKMVADHLPADLKADSIRMDFNERGLYNYCYVFAKGYSSSDMECKSQISLMLGKDRNILEVQLKFDCVDGRPAEKTFNFNPDKTPVEITGEILRWYGSLG